jgi:hypothetical protein
VADAPATAVVPAEAGPWGGSGEVTGAVPAAPAQAGFDTTTWVYLGSAAFVLVAVMVLGLGMVAEVSLGGRLPFAAGAPDRGGSATPYGTGSPYDTSTPGYSPTPDSTGPSPEASFKDPADMDAESTDPTPFTEDEIFPEASVTADDGAVYTLDASGFFSACTDSGGADTEALMRAHGCGNMLTADYTDDNGGLFVSTMVIPLPSTGDATAVQEALNADGSEAFNELTVFCPHDAPYNQTICHGSADPSWHATFTHYHRYLLIAMDVMEDGSDTPDTTRTRDAGYAVIDALESALDG